MTHGYGLNHFQARYMDIKSDDGNSARVPPVQEEFRCPLCNDRFRSLESLQFQHRFDHAKEEKEFLSLVLSAHFHPPTT